MALTGTMVVKNAAGGNETVEKPLAPARASAAESRPVVLSEEDLAQLAAIQAFLASIAGNTGGTDPVPVVGHPDTVNRSHVVAAADGAQTNFALLTVATGLKIILTSLVVWASRANTVNVDVRLGFGSTNVPTPALAGQNFIALDGRAIAPGDGIALGNGLGIVGFGFDGADLRLTCGVPTGGHLTISYTYYTVPA